MSEIYVLRIGHANENADENDALSDRYLDGRHEEERSI